MCVDAQLCQLPAARGHKWDCAWTLSLSGEARRPVTGRCQVGCLHLHLLCSTFVVCREANGEHPPVAVHRR